MAWNDSQLVTSTVGRALECVSFLYLYFDVQMLFFPTSTMTWPQLVLLALFLQTCFQVTTSTALLATYHVFNSTSLTSLFFEAGQRWGTNVVRTGQKSGIGCDTRKRVSLPNRLSRLSPMSRAEAKREYENTLGFRFERLQQSPCHPSSLTCLALDGALRKH